MLSILIFFPLLGGLSLMLLPKSEVETLRWVALIISLLECCFALPLCFLFDKSTPMLQFTEQVPWIQSLNISYSLGIDGFSLLFVVLTAIVMVILVLVSWQGEKHSLRTYLMLLLTATGCFQGLFMAADLFLFVTFWHLLLLPLCFLLGFGRHSTSRTPQQIANVGLLSGTFLVLGSILLVFHSGHTFAITELSMQPLPLGTQRVIFCLFVTAFACLFPLWPVHRWLPVVQAQAPCAGSIMLSVLFPCLGAYGILRLCLPIFPDAIREMSVPLVLFSGGTLLYGTIACISQTVLRSLLAYIAIGQIGFVGIGLFVLNRYGLEGSLLYLVNHGLVITGLFGAISILFERTRSQEIAAHSGLATLMPLFSTFFGAFLLAAMALPGTGGFVSILLVLLGSMKTMPWIALPAAIGLLWSTWALGCGSHRLFFGPVHEASPCLNDLSPRELALLLIPLLLVVWLGLVPNTLLDFLHVPVAHLLAQMHSHTTLGAFGHL